MGVTAQWLGLSIHVTVAGEEQCNPGHRFGPAVRDYFLLHVVESGKGTLHNEHGSFHVKSGQAFLILPSETTVYCADKVEPWHYVWVGFTGGGVETDFAELGINSCAPVFDLGNQCPAVLLVLRELFREATSLRAGELSAVGGVYRLIAHLRECTPVNNLVTTPSERYYRKALWLMEAGDTNVQSIADRIGLSRSQLFRVFKKTCNQSPKTVLDRKRLEQAVRLLEKTDLTLESVADATGYSSAARLCDVFRNAGLATPSIFRKKRSSR